MKCERYSRVALATGDLATLREPLVGYCVRHF